MGRSLLDTVDRPPYDHYASLRRLQAPVWDEGLKGWLVADYATCAAVGRQEADFPLPWKSLPGAAEIQGDRGLALLLGQEHHLLHTRLLGHFHRMAADESTRTEVVAPIVNVHLDEIFPRGAADLAVEFADRVHLPMMVALLGLPPQPAEVEARWLTSMADLGRWMELVRRGIREEDLDEPWQGLEGDPDLTCGEVFDRGRRGAAYARQILRPYVEERAHEPTGDLISAVWRIGRSVFDDWSCDDVIDTCASFTNTTATTGGFLCNSIALLLAESHIRELCVAHPHRWVPRLVEESLRVLPPAHVRARVVKEPGRLAEHGVRPGDAIFPISASANRDEEVFDEPEAVRLGRDNVRRHQAFSVGPRYCVGAPLVRAIGTVTLTRLLARLRELEPDPTGPPPEVRGFNLRSLRPLHAKWRPD